MSTCYCPLLASLFIEWECYPKLDFNKHCSNRIVTLVYWILSLYTLLWYFREFWVFQSKWGQLWMQGCPWRMGKCWWWCNWTNIYTFVFRFQSCWTWRRRKVWIRIFFFVFFPLLFWLLSIGPAHLNAVSKRLLPPLRIEMKWWQHVVASRRWTMRRVKTEP